MRQHHSATCTMPAKMSKPSRTSVAKEGKQKKGKAMGVDNILNEVLNNEPSVNLLHALYSLCFGSGMVPLQWNQVLLKPIPKYQTSDKRNPQFYRGISLISSIANFIVLF